MSLVRPCARFVVPWGWFTVNNRVMTPVRWGPWGKGHRVIQPEGPESADSVEDVDGMSTISVERVANEVEAALAEA